RRQHTHVIGGRPIHTTMASGYSSPDVAAADHDGCLDTESSDFLDAIGDPTDDLRRNVFARTAFLKSFPAQLEDNALVGGRRWFALHDEGDDQQNVEALGSKMRNLALKARFNSPFEASGLKRA